VDQTRLGLFLSHRTLFIVFILFPLPRLSWRPSSYHPLIPHSVLPSVVGISPSTSACQRPSFSCSQLFPSLLVTQMPVRAKSREAHTLVAGACFRHELKRELVWLEWLTRMITTSHQAGAPLPPPLRHPPSPSDQAWSTLTAAAATRPSPQARTPFDLYHPSLRHRPLASPPALAVRVTDADEDSRFWLLPPSRADAHVRARRP